MVEQEFKPTKSDLDPVLFLYARISQPWHYCLWAGQFLCVFGGGGFPVHCRILAALLLYF